MAAPSLADATFVNKLGRAYAKVLRRLGRCIYPLNLNPSPAVENFELWGILRNRSTTKNKWELTPSQAKTGDGPSRGNPSDFATVSD